MRVLVCGGRDYANTGHVWNELDAVHAATPITLIIEGGAHGVDDMAVRWAVLHDVPGRTFWAEWGSYGRGAGPRRNAQMLKEGRPDLVLAFAGGRGTQNMMDQAEAAGVRVVRIPPALQAGVGPPEHET